MPAPATVISLDEIAPVPVGGPDFSLTWLPVRHALGIRAFGTNAYVATDAGDHVVEPHAEGTDPAADHQELYFVARGSARFTIDGTDHEAPSGSYVFIPDPRSHRQAVALEAGTTVLSFGGPPTFAPSAWEWCFRAAALSGDPATRSEAREIVKDALSRFPEEGSVLYAAACVEALDGDREPAAATACRACGAPAARELGISAAAARAQAARTRTAPPRRSARRWGRGRSRIGTRRRNVGPRARRVVTGM